MKAKQSVPNTQKLPESLGKRWKLAERRCSEIVDLDQHPPVRYTTIYAKNAQAELAELKEMVVQELSNLKAQVRKEIEEQAPEDWMSYDEKNGYDIAITDCLSIPSLKEANE